MGSAVWSFWEHELKRRHVAQTHLALRRKPYPGTTLGAGRRLHIPELQPGDCAKAESRGRGGR